MRPRIHWDTPLMGTISGIADLILLNLVVLLACLPVVTIGAGMTGMYHSLIQMRRGERAHLIRTFWSSFRDNFRQATVIWLLQLAASAVLTGDFIIVRHSNLHFPAFITVVSAIAFAFLCMAGCYVYPLLSHFQNSVAQTMKNAFFISIMQFPKTVLMLLILASPVLLFLNWAYGAFFIGLLGVTGPAFLSAGILNPIFKSYESQQ